MTAGMMARPRAGRATAIRGPAGTDPLTSAACDPGGSGSVEASLLTSRYLILRFLSIRLPAGRRYTGPPVPRESGSVRR